MNGRFNWATERAVRSFQRQAGLPMNGQVDDALLDNLRTHRELAALMQHLNRTRTADVAAARRALMSQAETRDLVDEGPARAADPTRDPGPCFRAPSAGCLLAEAAESARAVHREELRDWAFGEILVVQARAGLADHALASVREIGDPRLVLVALRDIAEAHAAAGKWGDALTVARIIPDPVKQAEAWAAVAEAQVRHGADPGKTLAGLVALLSGLDNVSKRVAFRARAAVIAARAAVIAARAGDTGAARVHLDAAERLTRDPAAGGDAGTALRHVAAALAEMENPTRALAVLHDVPHPSDRIPVLVAAATVQARSGQTVEARATARRIDAARYRVVALAEIASAQGAAGDRAGALATVDEALAAGEAIRRPYAQDYAISRLALVALELAAADGGASGGYDRAETLAGRIEDDRLRAETLWAVAAERRRAADLEGADRTTARADAATRAIRSQVAQSWLFADLAERYVDRREAAAASDAFRRGLAIAARITNAWGRARAVARMASAWIVLRDAGYAAAP